MQSRGMRKVSLSFFFVKEMKWKGWMRKIEGRWNEEALRVTKEKTHQHSFEGNHFHFSILMIHLVLLFAPFNVWNHVTIKRIEDEDGERIHPHLLLPSPFSSFFMSCILIRSDLKFSTNLSCPDPCLLTNVHSIIISVFRSLMEKLRRDSTKCKQFTLFVITIPIKWAEWMRDGKKIQEQEEWGTNLRLLPWL